MKNKNDINYAVILGIGGLFILTLVGAWYATKDNNYALPIDESVEVAQIGETSEVEETTTEVSTEEETTTFSDFIQMESKIKDTLESPLSIRLVKYDEEGNLTENIRAANLMNVNVNDCISNVIANNVLHDEIDGVNYYIYDFDLQQTRHAVLTAESEENWPEGYNVYMYNNMPSLFDASINSFYHVGVVNEIDDENTLTTVVNNKDNWQEDTIKDEAGYVIDQTLYPTFNYKVITTKPIEDLYLVTSSERVPTIYDDELDLVDMYLPYAESWQMLDIAEKFTSKENTEIDLTEEAYTDIYEIIQAIQETEE